MKVIIVLLTVGLLMVCSSAQVFQAKSITLKQLLAELHDIRYLTQSADPPFTSRSITSRDRCSVSPKQPSTWFSNNDQGNTLFSAALMEEAPYFAISPVNQQVPTGKLAKGTRVGLNQSMKVYPGYTWVHGTDSKGRPISDRIQAGYVQTGLLRFDPEGHTIAEITGPGVITRIACANPSDAGQLRFIIDGKEVFHCNLRQLLDGSYSLSSGINKKWKPFANPLTEENAGYLVFQFPIPFQQQALLKVEKPNISYQVHYREYAPGTNVESFQNIHLNQFNESIETCRENLKARKLAAYPILGEKKETLIIPVLKPLEEVSKELPADEQGSMLTKLELKLETASWEETLRTTLLQVQFDDSKTNSICVPLGHFFATVPTLQPHRNLMTEVKADGTLISHWPMPYARRMRLILSNQGKIPFLGQVELTHAPHFWSPRSLHFHALWSVSHPIPARPIQDIRFCDIKGAGHFVGTILHCCHPTPGWWGEGKEKLFIDDETFPSHLGTATDEYFGFRSGNTTKPNLPLAGYSGHNPESSTLYRWNLLDRIPFTKHFEAHWETWHESPKANTGYACTTFWYGQSKEATSTKITPELLRLLPHTAK